MSFSAFSAAMLAAGAPVNSPVMASAAPVLAADRAENVQESGVQEVTPPPIPPPSPAESNISSEADAQAPIPAEDEGAIVVTAKPAPPPGDPLEQVNVKSFEAVQAVDKAVVGPVALAYKDAVPSPVRSGLRNVLSNLREPVVFLNFLLQLKPGKAAETLGRFAINSTIGAAGLFDIAEKRPFNLPRRPNGFADTLGYYGVKPGPYFYLPLVGPTTLRDMVGDGLDTLVLPLSIGKPFSEPAYVTSTYAIRSLDERAEFDEQLHRLRDGTADPYAATREYYLQMRQAEIDELRGARDAQSNPPPDPDGTNPADPSACCE